MKVLSVNVGCPREVAWGTKTVLTSIWKSPVEGAVQVGLLGLDGDQQSDLSVHGGRRKAVYAYPSEHYPRWRLELPEMELPWSSFGENLTTEGLMEDRVHIGDRFRIGSAEFIVTQPRMPCFKLGIRLGEPEMIERFLRSGRSGFYFSVAREGALSAGDSIHRISEERDNPTVSDILAQSGEGRSWKK
jgi:MOSC domain-containing protein YiiM